MTFQDLSRTPCIIEIGFDSMKNSDSKTQSWQQLLGGGFAGMDSPLAVHPNDARRARKIYFAAMREKVALEDIKDATAEYLKEHSWKPDNISKQIRRVESFLKSIKPTQKKKVHGW